MYSERQRPDLQDWLYECFPRKICSLVSPKVYGIVFVCDDLNDKGRLVIGVRENRYRPVVVM